MERAFGRRPERFVACASLSTVVGDKDCLLRQAAKYRGQPGAPLFDWAY